MSGYVKYRTTILSGPKELDALELPDGRKVGDVSSPQLARCLVSAGIPGAGHHVGRSTNAEAYKAWVKAHAIEGLTDAP